MEYRICFTGVMLCCQSVLAGPCNTYKERCPTGKEMTDDRVCFALLIGRNRKVQSAIRDIPAIRSNGGASRCQLITDPTGYSVTNSSANSPCVTDRCLLTFSIRKSNIGGILFPFERLPFSKL